MIFCVARRSECVLAELTDEVSVMRIVDVVVD